MDNQNFALPEELTIRKTRKGSIIPLMFSLFLALSFIYFLFPWKYTKEPMLSEIIMFVGLSIITLIILINLIIKIAKPQAIIIVNDKGIFDNSPFIGVGFIPWEKISNFNVVIIKQTENYERYLGIDLITIDDFNSNLKAIKRRNIEANLKNGNNPILISLKYSQRSYEETAKILEEYRSKYRKNKFIVA